VDVQIERQITARIRIVGRFISSGCRRRREAAGGAEVWEKREVQKKIETRRLFEILRRAFQTRYVGMLEGEVARLRMEIGC